MFKHVCLTKLLKPKFTFLSVFKYKTFSFANSFKVNPRMKMENEKDFEESAYNSDLDSETRTSQERPFGRSSRPEMTERSPRFDRFEKTDRSEYTAKPRESVNLGKSDSFREKSGDFRTSNYPTTRSLNEYKPRRTGVDVKVVFSEYCDKHIQITEEEVTKFFEEHQIKIKSEDKIPKPLIDLNDLRLEQRLNSYFSSNFKTPTPIQSITWPIAQQGKNLVGVAETGSGKTLSFILPALNHIHNQNPGRTNQGPIVLILAPTRELANQIHTVAREYGQKIGIRTACLYGGTPRGPMARQLHQGVELVVATPGRLLDLLNYGDTNLNRTSFVVLDEADRMLDMGFERDLRKILPKVHSDAQMLMWSATWPKEIISLAEEFLKKYVHVKIGKNENGLAINNRIKQNFIFCENMDKKDKLDQLLQMLEKQHQLECEENKLPSKNKLPKSILFTNQKYKCESLTAQLKGLGYKADYINGDKSQNERDYAISRFKKSEIDVLVATDVAARGLDINDVKTVINYDFPNNIEDYVHRIGRTGRSGKTGVSYAFFCRDSYSMSNQLISLLQKADQEIPAELEDIRHTKPEGSGSRNRRRGGGGYGGNRSGENRSNSYSGGNYGRAY
jgi:ATP-dependent RNA helicase DDX5/DBP2